ncbi:hypothetical protein ACW23B_10730 [Streptomyces albidoflavus]
MGDRRAVRAVGLTDLVSAVLDLRVAGLVGQMIDGEWTAGERAGGIGAVSWCGRATSGRWSTSPASSSSWSGSGAAGSTPRSSTRTATL